MNILAFSDLHRDVDSARKIVAAGASADVLVGAGDFATRGKGAQETIAILKTAGVPTVIVSGNHDNFEELRELCLDWQNGFLLHGEAVVLGGVAFFGLGCEVPQRNPAPWNEALSEDEASRLLALCPDKPVLVTHSPPHGIADLQRDGTHEGSSAIHAAIEEKQPIVHLCGHIHFSWGSSGHIGKTPSHNLGPTLNWFDV